MKSIYTCSIFIFACIFCFNIVVEVQGTEHAIQIMAPVNHSMQLRLDEFKQILEADDIKDRHIVVVSIAGAFRQGKSFLMNIFIKYLNAKVFDIEIVFEK